MSNPLETIGEQMRVIQEGVRKTAKWRVPITTYVVVEGETPSDAVREIIARQEAIGRSNSIEQDMLLNMEVDYEKGISAEEPPEIP